MVGGNGHGVRRMLSRIEMVDEKESGRNCFCLGWWLAASYWRLCAACLPSPLPHCTLTSGCHSIRLVFRSVIILRIIVRDFFLIIIIIISIVITIIITISPTSSHIFLYSSTRSGVSCWKIFLRIAWVLDGACTTPCERIRGTTSDH